MKAPSPRLLATIGGLLVLMALAAWGVRATTPSVTPPEARILAFAAPGAIVAGERATAFGTLELSQGAAWHRLDVCEAAGACRSLAPSRLTGEKTAWMGAAGHIALDRPGTYEVVWRVFVDAGHDTPWLADLAATSVEVVEANDAHR